VRVVCQMAPVHVRHGPTPAHSKDHDDAAKLLRMPAPPGGPGSRPKIADEVAALEAAAA